MPASKAVELETMYDAGDWFVGVAGHLMRGRNTETNIGLATITPRKVTTTGGVRLLDRSLIIAAQWVLVRRQQRSAGGLSRPRPATNWSISM